MFYNLMQDEFIARHFDGQFMAIDDRGFSDLSSLARRMDVGVRAQAPEAAGAKVPVARGHVAVLPIIGSIVHREDGWGAVSTQFISAYMKAAMDAPEVSTIVMDISSWGGSVHGIDELAAQIRGYRDSKQIIAVCNAACCSAAYYIGSAAGKIYSTPTGEMGSIGVLLVTADYVDAMAKEGVTVRILRKPPAKAALNMYEKPTDETIAYQQGHIDTYYQAFLDAVGQNRGKRVSTIEAEFGGGRTLLAGKAAEVGMIDGIKTLDQILSELARPQANGRTSSRVSVASARQALNSRKLAQISH